MPMSIWANTDEAIRHIRLMKPKTVLDIGVGFGKWGYLIRGSVETEQGNRAPYDWQITIEGVEACNEYLNFWPDILCMLYNNIWNEDVMDFEFGDYDMIIAGDVLEHLKRVDAINTMRAILAHCRSFIFVIPTGEGWSNSNAAHVKQFPFEEHKSEWEPKTIVNLAKHFGFKTQVLSASINNKTVHTFLGEKQ